MVLKLTVPPDLVHGDVDAGYGKVADAFRRNLTDGQEVGAAVAVYRDGTKVVDLWGGYRNGITKQPWQRDTMVNVFSTTKGVAALTVALAVSRGLFSYDDTVAAHWPEFAREGKSDITVRQLLAHEAGLSSLKPVPTVADIADPQRLSAILAQQKPLWQPGTRHGYHAVTLGWYESELIRRTDPAGRTLGRFLADEIAARLGLDLYVGLPATVDRERLALLHNWMRSEAVLHLHEMPMGFATASLNPFGLLARASRIPLGVDPWNGDYNRDDVRAIEIPSANGIGTARSVARLYAAAMADLGLNQDTIAALTAPAKTPSGGDRDRVINVDASFSLGMCKPTQKMVFGSSEKAYGTPGFGGSFGFADPDTGIGFSYVMNRLGFQLWSDPRELAIRQALFRDVLGERRQI